MYLFSSMPRDRGQTEVPEPISYFLKASGAAGAAFRSSSDSENARKMVQNTRLIT
jgi:hypothetical protein